MLLIKLREGLQGTLNNRVIASGGIGQAEEEWVASPVLSKGTNQRLGWGWVGGWWCLGEGI